MKKLLTLFSVLFVLSVSQAQTTLQEGFESWPPQDWEFYLLGQALDGWRDDFNGNANSGTGSAYSSIDNAQSDNWMVSPAINVVNAQYVLRFWELHTSPEFYDRASVWISTGSGNPSDGQFVLAYEATTLNTVEWEERVVNLSAYDGETIYVAFRHEGTFHAWNIDDVTVAPASFADAALIRFLSPIGGSETPVVAPVVVEIENKGTSAISSYSIEWDVNGVSQPIFNSGFVLIQPGDIVSANLGDFDFSTEDSYDITANVVLANDFDPSNDQITNTFDVTAFRDGGIVGISPEGIVPVQGDIDVKATITNFGANTIDIVEVSWSVNDVAQTAFSSNNLNLLPGETRVVIIGNFTFPEGVNTISATLNAFGDINANNDTYETSAAMNTFYESFEGAEFPPEGWSMNFGVLDNINFGNPVEGLNYYTANVDDNFFGVVEDTLYTPLLNIEAGDTFSFYIKTSGFQPADHKLVFKDGVTGEVTVIADIQNSPGTGGNWAFRTYDISVAAGVNQIGVSSTPLGGGGQTNFDLFTSTSNLHQFNNDMRMLTGNIPFVSRQNINTAFECKIRNAGALPRLGSDYTVKLMEGAGVELASVSGVDLQSWEEAFITIDYTFTEITNTRLYFEIAYAQDENPSDNRVLSGLLSVVPETAIVNAIGAPDVPGFLPFTPNGSTNSLGEDDLSESLYFNEEITNPGLAYGIVYKYDNLLPTKRISEYPLQVWIAQKNLENLEGGWQDPDELVLVFDGIAEFLPGDNRDLYIPFDQPIMINGIEDVVVKHYQYDPQWPPAIFRFSITNVTSGPVRSIGAFEVFELDPLSPPDSFFAIESFPLTGFLVDPATDNSVLTGTVTDANTTLPIENATISITGSSITAQTDVNGNYTLPSLPFGLYEITVSQLGYASQTFSLELNSTNQVQDVALVPLAEVSIFGTVYGSNDLSTTLGQVEVVLSEDGTVVDTVTTDANGLFTFPSTFEDTVYEVSASLYGYFTQTLGATPGTTDLNLGDVILDEEFISPFDVVVDAAGNPNVSWKTPKLSAKEKLQRDLDFVSNSYTNEPLEEVWLGNEFEITEMTTITSVEIRTDVFDLAEDFVTIDIFDIATENIIASSEPFLMVRNSLITVDIPNIVVTDNIAAMVHWQNNAESTNSLVIDFTLPSEDDAAVIKYPGQPITLISPFLGGGSIFMAFHVRVNTLTDGTPITNNEAVSYNVFRGLASEFPDITNWEQLNVSPISDLTYVDSNLGAIDSNEFYRYAVETIYNEGESEVTFSGEVLGQAILNITDAELLEKKILLYPNPVEDEVTLQFLSNLVTDKPIEIYNTLGKQILVIDPDTIESGYLKTNVAALATGVYFIKLDVNGTEINKKFIKN